MKRSSGIFVKSIRDFFKDNYLYHAAALSYVSLMSFFSIFIVVFVMVSYLPYDLSQVVSLFSRLFPQKSFDYISVVETLAKGRTTLGVFGFVMAYYFATSLFRQINRAILFVIGKPHPVARYWYRHIVSIPALLILLFLLYVIVLSLSWIFSLLRSFITLPHALKFITADLGPIFSYIIDFVVFSMFLFFIYFMYLSKRNNLLPKNIIIVSLLTGFLLMVLKETFGMIYKWLLRANPIYGSFATILFFMLWMYVFFGILLLGARMIYYSNKTQSLDTQSV